MKTLLFSLLLLPSFLLPSQAYEKWEETKSIEKNTGLIKVTPTMKGLTEFPKEIFDKPGNVSILDLSNQYPKNLQSADNSYKELLKSYNMLTTIPKQIETLTNLTQLDLSNNNIPQLPAEIGKLPLKVLNVSGNPIQSMPPFVFDLSLEKFMASDCGLTEFSSDTLSNKWDHLRLLNLMGNNIPSLSSTIFNLPALQDLFLPQLVKFPEGIKASCLKVLIVTSPFSDSLLKNLETLGFLSKENKWPEKITLTMEVKNPIEEKSYENFIKGIKKKFSKWTLFIDTIKL